jgi:hypothetical protein
VRADPNKIVVAAIAGPPDPYNVIMVPPTLTQDPAMWPNVDHSCVQTSKEYADPAVRIASFVQGFGSKGLSTSTRTLRARRSTPHCPPARTTTTWRRAGS